MDRDELDQDERSIMTVSERATILALMLVIWTVALCTVLSLVGIGIEIAKHIPFAWRFVAIPAYVMLLCYSVPRMIPPVLLMVMRMVDPYLKGTDTVHTHYHDNGIGSEG